MPTTWRSRRQRPWAAHAVVGRIRLFAGSLRGGRAAAVIYSLIGSCELAGVDVLAYLADVLVRVATHPANRIDELLPVNWAANFAQPTRPAATA
jgi:transposase